MVGKGVWESGMKGRAEFTPASGKTQDERTVRMDYNTSKPVGGVRYGRYYIFFKGVEKWVYVDYNDIVWAYRRMEDVQSRLKLVSEGVETHSIMLVTKDKKRVGIPVGNKENALEGLAILQKKNKFVDIGFSREKEDKYL